MNRIYLPSAGSHDWHWLLANPGRHWKHGASAMALADSWEHADGWPPPVAAVLATGPGLSSLQLLLAIPEHKVPLPGGDTASQSDAFVLARQPDGRLVSIAVEGKAEEPFGDETVAEWRAQDTESKRERLKYLLGVLGLADDERLAPIRYQLLHRTASALIEAQRFGARHAVMLVHSFSPKNSWFDDFEAFAALYGARVEIGRCVEAASPNGIELHLAWVSDQPRPLPDASPPLGPRFDRAFAAARELHASQPRKGGREIPYISHLMGVASLDVGSVGLHRHVVGVVDQAGLGGGPRLREHVVQSALGSGAQPQGVGSDDDADHLGRPRGERDLAAPRRRLSAAAGDRAQLLGPEGLPVVHKAEPGAVGFDQLDRRVGGGAADGKVGEVRGGDRVERDRECERDPLKRPRPVRPEPPPPARPGRLERPPRHGGERRREQRFGLTPQEGQVAVDDELGR